MIFFFVNYIRKTNQHAHTHKLHVWMRSTNDFERKSHAITNKTKKKLTKNSQTYQENYEKEAS